MAAEREFPGFCSSHHARLVGTLGLYCGDRFVAEELAQEALARAWARWPKVSGLDDPAAWLYRVAFNLANSHYRRKAAESRANERLATQPAFRSDDEIAAAVEIRDAIAQLSKRKRTALILRYYADLPFAEIAIVMDAPESTVKSLARRAIQDLRGELGSDARREAEYAC